jgi:hypothetical protein
MNVKEMVNGTKGSLSHYAATAIGFTAATVWIIVAFQSKHIFGDETSFWHRLAWPFMLMQKLFTKTPREEDDVEIKEIPR